MFSIPIEHRAVATLEYFIHMQNFVHHILIKKLYGKVLGIFYLPLRLTKFCLL